MTLQEPLIGYLKTTLFRAGVRCGWYQTMQVDDLESRQLYVKWYLSQNKMICLQKLYLGLLVAYSIGCHYEGAYTGATF